MTETERIRKAALDPDLKVPRDGYDRFRLLLRQWTEKMAGKLGREATELVLLVPDVLMLFAGLARDPRVDKRHKLFAAGVVAYLISPVDLAPEILLGPLGIADDVVLAFLALDTILNRVPHNVLLDHWRGHQDIIEVARMGTALGTRIVPRQLYDRVTRWLARAGG